MITTDFKFPLYPDEEINIKIIIFWYKYIIFYIIAMEIKIAIIIRYS